MVDKMPENLSGQILQMFLGTPLNHPVRFFLFLQFWLWRRKPSLTERLSNFLPIAGTGSVVQILLLVGLIHAGTHTFLATVLALGAGAFVSFVGNWFITWQDRFVLLTRRQQMVWFMPLLLIFSISTPTIWMKLFGINSLEYFFGVHVLVSWFVFTAMGAVANYLGADVIAFGVIPKIINRIGDNCQEEKSR